MIGERTVVQEALFYEFSLEHHVPGDHLVRGLDRFSEATHQATGTFTPPRQGPAMEE